jgi:UDP-N-acetylmuramoyl-tripeptide--D-alanyl-D-alanine ligase
MMTLIEAANALNAVYSGPDTGLRINAISTDSRKIVPGDLFIALRGDKFDGHDFVTDVLAAGAAAALVDGDWPLPDANDGRYIVVSDTRLALGQLAAWWRDKFTLPVLGLTGSNGKTTVKEMCAAILAQAYGKDAVLATVGNLNNDIGCPLTLLRLRSHHRAAVIEMGMNHAGEIDYLTRLTAPTVALVNNAQRAHLEGLGGLDGVARAKGEIFLGLAADGTAIINADDAAAGLWHELALDGNPQRKVVTFGLSEEADVRAEVSSSVLASTILMTAAQGSASFTLPVPGLHNARNAMGAAAACLALGVAFTDVVHGLASYGGVAGRLQQKTGLKGALVIDDSYNANPDSMRAAMDVLAALPGKRIFVMGDMGEVGETAGQVHDELGGYAKSKGIDRLYCLGELSVAAARNFGDGGQYFRRLDELVRTVKSELDPQTTVLVKGSRFMRMERVVEAIVASQTALKEDSHAT